VSTFNDAAVGGAPVARDQALFGQVMGYVAVTVGFTALGAYLGRVGLNVAVARGREQLAIGLLFGLGLLLGLAVAPVIADYALFWALLALIVFGIVAIFVAIPAANAIYALAGLVIFGGFTIVDFNRLRRATPDSAVLVAASIFLDVFNVFLLLLDLFGGERD